MFIYDAAMRYADEGVPLIVIAGREYGSGSSRDWAAKGPALLGVRAVMAESYERIHRSNLVGMGILPLQFRPGDSVASLGLTGRETFAIHGLDGGAAPRQTVTVTATADADAGGDGRERRFEAIARLDGPIDVDYFAAGGILPAVLRRLAAEPAWDKAKPPGEDRGLRTRGGVPRSRWMTQGTAARDGGAAMKNWAGQPDLPRPDRLDAALRPGPAGDGPPVGPGPGHRLTALLQRGRGHGRRPRLARRAATDPRHRPGEGHRHGRGGAPLRRRRRPAPSAPGGRWRTWPRSPTSRSPAPSRPARTARG